MSELVDKFNSHCDQMYKMGAAGYLMPIKAHAEIQTAIEKLEAERDHFSKLAANQHSCGPDCRDKAALIAERDELKEFKRAVGKHLNLADDDDGMSLIGRFNQQVGRLEVKAKKWDLIERVPELCEPGKHVIKLVYCKSTEPFWQICIGFREWFDTSKASLTPEAALMAALGEGG